MNAVHDKHLAVITRIGKHFLVAGHAGVEADLTRCGPDLSECFALKKTAVLEEKKSALLNLGHFFESGFKMQKKRMVLKFCYKVFQTNQILVS